MKFNVDAIMAGPRNELGRAYIYLMMPYTIAIRDLLKKFNTIEYNAYREQPKSIYLYNMPQRYQCMAARQLPTAQ